MRIKMNYKIAICDDDVIFMEEITRLILNYQFERNIDISVSSFTNGKYLISNYKKSGDFQILFLDIEMPELNGLELASIIRTSIDRHVFIVFISSYPEYMHESFRVHPYNYLQKPVSHNTLFAVLDEIRLDLNDNSYCFTINSIEKKSEVVNFNDVLYIETKDSKKSLLSFCLTDRKILARGTIKDWSEKLKHLSFQKCHTSYLANLTHIHYFSDSELIMDNSDKLPLSRRMKKDLETAYKKQIVSHNIRRK